MKLQRSSGKNRACIILRCLNRQKIPDQNRWVERMEYNICIVDLKSDIAGIVDVDDGFTLVSPTFQIDCGTYERYRYVRDAFCVLGQTLYVFEGSSSREEEPRASSRKSVFALDLTRTQTLTQRTTKLAREDGPLLRKICDMTFPKPRPAALPTPEGDKIVVFSRCNFELFEPANRSWEQLPELVMGDNYIQAYGFIQGSKKLVVQTTNMMGGGKTYGLDLARSPDDRRWVRLGSIYSGVEGIPCGYSFFEMLEQSRFCFFNRCGFYDLEEYVGEDDRKFRSLLGFTPPRREDEVSVGGHYYAALLNYEEEKGECDFCHMVMESPPSQRTTQTRRTVMNVCRVDLKSYKEMADRLSLDDLRWSEELKRSKTTIVKRLAFSLCFEGNRGFKEHHLLFTF